jgi:hypothetical protein
MYDLILDLGVDLVIDGRAALVVNKEIHRQFLPFICTCTVYTVDTQLSRGTRKVGQTKKLRCTVCATELLRTPSVTAYAVPPPS